MKLSLDSLTLTNTQPVELIRAASSAGFDMVSLWVQPPPIFPSQLVTTDNVQACKAALKETGLKVASLEVFVISSLQAINSFRPALQLGAELGATSAAAIYVGKGTTAEAGELFAHFAAVAGEFELSVTLEPLAMFPLSTLTQAREVIRASGVDGGIVFDAFHLIHAGGSSADLHAVEPGLIRHAQLCDGMTAVTPEQMRYQASHERLYPGEGEFPLIDLFSHVATDITWGIEAPSKWRGDDGMTAEAQAKEAMASIRKIINSISMARDSTER